MAPSMKNPKPTYISHTSLYVVRTPVMPLPTSTRRQTPFILEQNAAFGMSMSTLLPNSAMNGISEVKCDCTAHPPRDAKQSARRRCRTMNLIADHHFRLRIRPRMSTRNTAGHCGRSHERAPTCHHLLLAKLRPPPKHVLVPEEPDHMGQRGVSSWHDDRRRIPRVHHRKREYRLLKRHPIQAHLHVPPPRQCPAGPGVVDDSGCLRNTLRASRQVPRC